VLPSKVAGIAELIWNPIRSDSSVKDKSPPPRNTLCEPEVLRRTRPPPVFCWYWVDFGAARKLAQGGRLGKVPATVAAIFDGVRWIEEIMAEIDRRHPMKPAQ
jgi:hypothetical protein